MSILAARLVEAGLLDLDRPLADIWPAFAAHGKDRVSVGDVLAHRAGVSAPRVDVTREQLLDFAAMAQIVADQEPLWRPGDGWAYHALTHGWLSGEIVRRAGGVAPGDAFAAMAEAVGGGAWLGMPAEVAASAAHLRVGPTLDALVARQAAERDPATIDWLDRAMTLGGALPATLVTADDGFNADDVRQAVIPGAGRSRPRARWRRCGRPRWLRPTASVCSRTTPSRSSRANARRVHRSSRRPRRGRAGPRVPARFRGPPLPRPLELRPRRRRRPGCLRRP